MSNYATRSPPCVVGAGCAVYEYSDGSRGFTIRSVMDFRFHSGEPDGVRSDNVRRAHDGREAVCSRSENPVTVVLKLLAGGMTPGKVLADYPDLEQADIDQCLAYAAALSDEQIVVSG